LSILERNVRCLSRRGTRSENASTSTSREA
jgi:hypothetical protein